jgi:hypothetical protein
MFLFMPAGTAVNVSYSLLRTNLAAGDMVRGAQPTNPSDFHSPSLTGKRQLRHLWADAAGTSDAAFYTSHLKAEKRIDFLHVVWTTLHHAHPG